MGDILSKENTYTDQEFLRAFQSEYIFLQDHIDHRLGRVKIYQGNQENYIAVKKVFAQQRDQFKDFIEKTLKKNLQLNNRFLIKLYTFQTHSDDSFCSQINDVEIYMEYYVNNAQEEIQRRIQVNLPYSEQELWAILYSIISASTYLESQNHPLCDIRPQNVYFTTRGEVKLLPFGMFPDDQTAYQKQMNMNEACLLSPEQLHKIQIRNLNMVIDQKKSDAFSIGMTVLYCAVLQGGSICYDYENCCINKEILYNLIEYASGQYSPFFIYVISLLLTENSNERPYASTIHAMLQPFEIEIMSLQPFNPDSQIMKQSLMVNGQVKNMLQSKIFPNDDSTLGVTQIAQQNFTPAFQGNPVFRGSCNGYMTNNLIQSGNNQGNGFYQSNLMSQGTGFNQQNQFYGSNEGGNYKLNNINNNLNIQLNQTLQRTNQVLGNRIYQ